MMATNSKRPSWLADRFGWPPLRDHVLQRRVPRTPWYYGDGAALALLFGVMVFTGALLLLFYSASPDTAYPSVQAITHQQPLGWFLRGLHYWSAGLMVVMVAFHLLREILVAGYKFPREGTWLTGCLLLALVLVMAYTGYTLRWDQRAVHAIRVLLHTLHHVPWIGDALVRIVQGDEFLGSAALSRMFALHVLIVPLLLLLLVGWHLYLVMYHGVTSPAERRQDVPDVQVQRELYRREAESPQRGEPFYPHTVAASGALAVAVFGLALGLTLVVGPPALMPEGNLVDPAQPAEEWWFWWYSGLIALLPPAIAPAFEVLFPLVVFALLLALPFLDRGPKRGIRRRPGWAVGVVVVAVALVYLSDLRRRSPWTGWPRDEPPRVPEGLVLEPRAEQGRLLFARYGCNSCHAVAGDGPQVGTDLATLADRYSRQELLLYIRQPPADVAMPAYADRMSPDELSDVVEFVLAAQTFRRRP